MSCLYKLQWITVKDCKFRASVYETYEIFLNLKTNLRFVLLSGFVYKPFLYEL